jgi:hypothetical protein
MATQYQYKTSATPDEIREAFRATFTYRPPWVSSLFSPKNKVRRMCHWKFINETDSDMAVELKTAGITESIMTENVGSVSGSIIAMSISDHGSNRFIDYWSPLYKTATVLRINQFSGLFKRFSGFFHAELRKVDPSTQKTKA